MNRSTGRDLRRMAFALVTSGALLAGSSSAVSAPQETKAGAAPAVIPCLVTDAPTYFTFAGKQITVPVGADYRLDGESLVISLTEKSEKEFAVVKIGDTFVVIARGEPLVIDPRGRPNTRRRFSFTLPGLRQLKVSSISDAPDASPVGP